MKKIFRILPLLITYFCIATVIGQVVLLGVLSAKKTISSEKANRILAVLYDIQDYPLTSVVTKEDRLSMESPSPEDIKEQRMLAILDMTLRENAIDKGYSNFVFLSNRLQDDESLFQKIKGKFDEEVKQKEKAAINEGIQKVQNNVEVMQPKQAKQTFLQMIDDGGLRDVVNVLAGMSQDKKKRILSEFKTPNEQDTLHDIMFEMLIGDVRLIENSQKRMNAQFESKQPQ